MTLREQILQQALALPTADQAFLAQSLEDHLIAHSAAEIDEVEGLAGDELQKELRRRSAACRSGNTSARSAAEVMADLRKRQADEKVNCD
jgi:hypothetical protein